MGRSRILVVDDDRDLCDLLAEVLIEEGYEVARAYTGQGAIDAARRAPPDAVLLDLVLPDLSGVAVGQALRAAPETRAVRIVMISGDRAALARATDEIGARASLEKPFSLAAVQSAVEAVLGPNTDAPAGP